MTSVAALYRLLPQMGELLELPEVQAWAREQGLSREFVRGAATAFLDQLRHGIAAGDLDEAGLRALLADAAAAVRAAGERRATPHLRRVVNATGIVVHTNLGRAPWSEAAVRRVTELAGGYVNLEMQLESGRRGGRERPVASLLQELLPGYEVAVVNNCAAALLLVLNSLAQGREVIVSRGQLVEIGGSFRVPEVMAKGFCRLREVGTTNRTRIDDYRAAIGPDTGLLLAVHPSNYRMVGFTESVPLEELVALGRERGVPVVEDLGSGSLVDLSPWGIDEPTVARRLEAGADLVLFSGDKLLGGPQAGFIVGTSSMVATAVANPLYRALRVDKATMLAVEATLADYLTGRHDAIPVLAMLQASPERLRTDAEALAARLRPILEVAGGAAEVVATEGRAGGGAAPELPLPSWAVAVTGPYSADELARRLRSGDPAVVGRIAEDRLLLDVRTLLPGDAERIVDAVKGVLASRLRHSKSAT